MAKQRTNAEKFLTFRARAEDVLTTSRTDIEKNANRNFGMGVFAEYEWLVQAVEQLTKNDPGKLNSLDLRLAGERAEAIPAAA